MNFFVDQAWLIPVTPMAFSFFLGILLISFSRTMNRLTKPITSLTIFSVAVSTVLSFLVFKADIAKQVLDWNLNLAGYPFHWQVYVDLISSEISLVAGLVLMGLMFVASSLLPRETGYVRNFVFFGFLSSMIFSFIFSGDLFHLFLAKIGA